MAVKDIGTLDKTFAEVIRGLSPELQQRILSSYTLEERVAGLNLEEWVAGLSPEKREQLKQLLR